MNIKSNIITVLGDGGGNGSDQNNGNPGGCCSIPTPQGPPDTYWTWPPYASPPITINDNIVSGWYNRHFLSENLLIPMGEVHYTLLYVEKLKSQFGGTVSSVWGKRINAVFSPGNVFIEDILVFGNPLGWKCDTKQHRYPGIKKNNSNNTYQTTNIIMTEGKFILNHICKIEKAGGYIFEVMKYISNYSFADDQPKIRMTSDYESFLSNTNFIYETAEPTSTTHDNYIDTNQIYSFSSNNSEGKNILKNYIKSLSQITQNNSYTYGWNSLICTDDITETTTTRPVTTTPRAENNTWQWSVPSIKQGLKDVWFGWGEDGFPVDDMVQAFFPDGWPRDINFDILHPEIGSNTLDFDSDQKEIIQQAIFMNHWIRCRSYYINICAASDIYKNWINSLKEFNDDTIVNNLYDYVDNSGNIILKNAINVSTLRSLYNNIYFKRYLVKNDLLTTFISPLAAGSNSFGGFTSWFSSYDFAAQIDTFNGSGSISNNETKLVDGILRHRISWEEALGNSQLALTINGQSVPIVLANYLGNNITLGPTNIA
jgi:hypothetical protein